MRLRKRKYRLGLSLRLRRAWSVWGYNDRLRRDVPILRRLSLTEARECRDALEKRYPDPVRGDA